MPPREVVAPLQKFQLRFDLFWVFGCNRADVHATISKSRWNCAYLALCVKSGEISSGTVSEILQSAQGGSNHRRRDFKSSRVDIGKVVYLRLVPSAALIGAD
jgi:hypothetical protein